MDVSAFIARWSPSGASERSNKDAFLMELCDVLEVPRPDPATGIPERDTYVFERDAFLPREGGRGSLGKIDLYKHGCFLLEAKQGSRQESRKLGAARRGTAAWNVAMQDAKGQALGYARTLDPPPPFLIVCDIGYCFDLYADFDGTAVYRPFSTPEASRMYLADLEDHRDLLRTVFLDPHSLDPSRRTSRVTREIAADLAELARELERSGHPPGTVAPFLMRCIFTMFAEHARLLDADHFTGALRDWWIQSPSSFPNGVETLWRTMKTGGPSIRGDRIRCFGGALFEHPAPLKLNETQLRRLADAGGRHWADVEPAIFGTLLERALDPRKRHELGAHFTPRQYVERLVKPAVEEPLRRQWELVQSEVRKLVDAGRETAAERRLQQFHQNLVHLRVLDPACGSGNFLYVALDLFKRLESEVVGYLARLGNVQPVLEMERAAVTPEQFRGIEVERWAKEIADLVLWIGYLQWQVKTYGSPKAVPEPILRDFGNIECRDALLDRGSGGTLARDEDYQVVSHWDGESYCTHPTTGQQVPDAEHTVPFIEYPDARPAHWPAADFVIGNPPFVGSSRMRSVLGHGYTEALRRLHADVPESADYVLYWWNHAARLLKAGKIRRFGFITTNSIRQKFARRVLAEHMQGKDRLSIVFAVPDHPWTLEAGADVRIAMTVARKGVHEGVLVQVVREWKGALAHEVEFAETAGKIHSDLSIGPDLEAAVPLRANDGLSCPGVKLHGSGFLVTPEQAGELGLGSVPGLENHIRPYLNGRDLLRRPRGLLVIDLYGLELREVRERFPAVYQWVLERVKPERDQNRRPSRRQNWWLFGECVPAWRTMSGGLRRYVTTAETSKHRIFTFLPAEVLPDNMLTNFAFDDGFYLGVLSSRIHVSWAQAVGARLGVGNDLRYTKTLCFEPFPFPAATEAQHRCIRKLGDSLDAHRKTRQAAHPDLELTDIYNVLDKERSGTPLTASEREIHARGLVAVLCEIHDELDAAVAEAYGWPSDVAEEEIVERLVALNAERAEEEREGRVRCLRPELQAPTGAGAAPMTQTVLPGAAPVAPAVSPAAQSPWPKSWPERVQSIHSLIGRGGAWTEEQVASRFRRAGRNDVKQVLESLSALGLAGRFEVAGTERWQSLRRP